MRHSIPVSGTSVPRRTYFLSLLFILLLPSTAFSNSSLGPPDDCPPPETVTGLSLLPPPEDCNNPMAGKSYVVDLVSSGLVGALQSGTTLGNLVDTDLSNYAEVDPTAVVLGSSLASVKRVNGSFPAGRRAGFVIESNNGLLSVDALGGLGIQTYQNDVLQETFSLSGGSVLSLGLLGTGTDGKQRIAFTTSLPYDEIELVLNTALSVGTSIRVYYAFDEDPTCDADCSTEIIPANGFSPSIVASRTGIVSGVCVICGVYNTDQIIDNDLTNGALIDYSVTVGGVFATSVATGTVESAGTDVGFVVRQSGVLGLLDLSVLSGFTIETYFFGLPREQISVGGGLANIALLPSGDELSLSVPTTQSFNEVRLVINSGLLGLLSNITVQNAFVRYDTDGDGVPDCIDKCVGDDNALNINGLPLACNPVCDVDAGLDQNACPSTDAGTAQLIAAQAGQTWSAVPGNPSPAIISSTGEITGLDATGTYSFVLSNGTCSDTVSVLYVDSAASSGCNDPITGPDVIVDNSGAIGGICLLCNTGDAQNVVDGNLRNFLEYNDLVSLLGSSSLISVKDTVNVYPAGSRAGYVIAFPGGLLNASVLSGIEIRTYLNDILQETGNTSLGLVTAAALGGANQQRVGFVTTLPYDEVEILYNSTVSALGSIQVYYPFTEDAACDFGEDFALDPSVLCIEPLIAESDYCATINYDATGFSGIACVSCNMSPLSALVDNDLTDGTSLNVVAGVANNSTLAVKSNVIMPAGYEAGFALSGNNGLLGAAVLGNISISTYLGGLPAESFAASSPLVDLSLLSGSSDVSFLGFTTSLPFDEVRLTVGGLVELGVLSNLEIYYAYIRVDSDGDGVPDCMDQCCSGDDLMDDDGNGIPNSCDGVPVAEADTYQVYDTAPVTLNVLLNDDFGPDSPDTAAIELISPPSFGTAVVDDMGTPLDPTDDMIVYTASMGMGMDTLIYQITDLNGSSDTALVIIEFDLNDAPLAVNDTLSTNEDTELTGDVVANDSDGDGPGVSVTLVDDVDNGSLTLYPDGTFSYTPDDDYSGPDSFSYSYCDGGTPDLCDTAVVMITVEEINDAPLAVNDTLSTDEDTELTGDVVANDSDGDGPGVSVSLIDDVDNGSLTLDPDGTFSYTPDDDYSGPDSFSYSYCDGGTPNLCDTAIVMITVEEVNDAPFAVNDTLSTDEETELTGNVVANDSDSDGPGVTVALIDDVDNGSLTLDPDGTFSYTPDIGYDGPDSFSYSYCDGGTPDLCDTAVVMITVENVPAATLSLKVMLQGALFDQPLPLMRDDLRAGGYLPLTEPYAAFNNPRFLHKGAGGGEITTQSVLDANSGTADAIVDWVFVELRNVLTPSLILETRSALLQRDGDVVSPTDGTSPLSFRGLIGEQYYVAVKHRNHLGVMTASPVTLDLTGTLVDFTTASAADVYHLVENFDGHEQVTVNGVQALWSGNTNADNQIKYQGPGADVTSILINVIIDAENLVQTYNYDSGFGYFLSDVNMDGKSKYQGVRNDGLYAFINLVSFSLNDQNLYNFNIFLEQLP
ncbi:tandem-95 repeat protein [Neolewinella aurantiaca]|uniref:Tandem-95 repeat protein n=1 Tax=Neolewinella aurantiaca TaxID=2602767 RepID=A0A5C7FUJ2_9BACT|nr:cadherin-like domain-containing protein [Neolewinella aurantiaca]TXF89115.1 tandem-95 repeat protein [Neolewinella aurantiaca]